MFKNLIKIALRIIRKDLFYSLFNIIGLTIGICSSLFLLLYIYDELSYDQYHEKADNIYRVVSHITEPDDAFTWVVAQIPFAPQVKEDYPEVDEYVRFIPAGRSLFRKGDLQFYEDEVYFIDSTVFSVFSFDLIKGNPETVLDEPGSMVVTESFAARYFGTEDPVGQTLSSGTDQTYHITGVCKNVPPNSHLIFSALISKNTLPDQFQQGSWGNFGVYTYLLLKPDVVPDEFESKLQELSDTYNKPLFERLGISIVYDLDPITMIHLHSKYEGEPEPTGSIEYIYIFGAVALFMLLIASINYMNLATSRSTRRAREVGLRKVVGSGRSLLIYQFLTESFVLTLISLILSGILLFLFLPHFNQLSGKLLSGASILKPEIILSAIAVLILISLGGGSYPAFYLSRFNPIKVLKGHMGMSYRKFSFRKVLVVIQFAISITMIINTWVVYDQVAFLRNKDVGFDKSNVVRINLNNQDMIRKSEVFKQKLKSHSNISYVGSTSTSMGEGSGKIIMTLETAEGDMDERGINIGLCDEDFIETLGISILEGRDFSIDHMADTATGVIINQTLARRMNWDQPIGKKVKLGQNSPDNQNPTARIVGLMKDYNQTGLYNEVESYLLLFRRDNRIIYVKISDQDIPGTISYIEQVWHDVYPDMPFEHTFLENDLNQQFEPDRKRGLILALFSLLTIIIASLGLFGLSSYTVEQRTKEIGIRKVMGAAVQNITTMISLEFFWLILISMGLAFPVSYYLMHGWLRDFVYRAALKPGIFILTGVLITFVAMLTITYHTIRAGRSNPVDAIRQE